MSLFTLQIPYHPDDPRFFCIGTFGAQGHQFYATVTPAWPEGSLLGQVFEAQERAQYQRWYGVCHRFDALGIHRGSTFECGGTAEDGDVAIEDAWNAMQEMLSELGEREPQSIQICPFAVREEGYLFGLIGYKDGQPSDHGPFDYVVLEPAHVLFIPPWDGSFST